MGEALNSNTDGQEGRLERRRASPSEEFADQVAKDTPPGLAFLTTLGSLANPLRNLLDSLNESLSHALESFGGKKKGEEEQLQDVEDHGRQRTRHKPPEGGGVFEARHFEVLNLLRPDAPVFTFPKEWEGVAINPIVTDLRRIRHVHPESGATNVPHEGIDIDVPEGAPIVLSAEGATVRESGYGTRSGNFVTLDVEGTLFTFMHLQSAGPLEGTKLKRGDVLGYVGHTGKVKGKNGSDGTHLHYEVDGGNKEPNDPLYLDSGIRALADQHQKNLGDEYESID